MDTGSSCLEQILVGIVGLLGAIGLLGLLGIEEDFIDPLPLPPDIVTVAPPEVSTFPAPTELPFYTPTPTAAPSSFQDAVEGVNNGEIPVGGSEVWSYEGNAGDVITIEIRAANPANDATVEERDAQGLLDTYAYVFDPSGFLIAEADDIEAGVQTDTQINELFLSEDGIYTIEVRSWSNTGGGEYTLSIKSGEASSATPDIGTPTPIPTDTPMPTPTMRPT